MKKIKKSKSRFYTPEAIDYRIDGSNELIPDRARGRLAESLSLLPREVIDFIVDNYVFLSSHADGWTLSRRDSRFKGKRGFILLHPGLWKKDMKTIAHTIAHESAHAFKNLGASPEQEVQADMLAVEWLSIHFDKKDLLKRCNYLGKINIKINLPHK